MTFETTAEAYPVKTDRTARRRSPRVREWGWLLRDADGNVLRSDHGFETKSAALAAAERAAEFYYGKER